MQGVLTIYRDTRAYILELASNNFALLKFNHYLVFIKVDKVFSFRALIALIIPDFHIKAIF